jgi:hypothetical protein
MKTLIYAIAFSFSSLLAAAASNDFDLHAAVSNHEFEKLNKLENYLQKNQNLSLSELKAEHPALLDGISLADNTTSFQAATAGDLPLVTGFWWGCCLGVIGLAVVYFITDNDKEQVKKALWGCVISTLIAGVGGLINPFGW